MSAALVRKGLQLVDPPAKKPKKDSSRPRRSTISKKQTVVEVRKRTKSKEDILKENLRKLELVKATSKVSLDKQIVKRIIDRAVTKRPVKSGKKRSKKQQKTVFTEEDFKKFEDEYLG